MSINQPIIDTLRPFAHRTDVDRVDEAAQALRPFGDEVVMGLADALSDDDDYFRVMALEVLGEWGGDTTAALPAVIGALDDPDLIVRICAAWLLSGIRDVSHQALPLLREMLSDGDDFVRSWPRNWRH